MSDATWWLNWAQGLQSIQTSLSSRQDVNSTSNLSQTKASVEFAISLLNNRHEALEDALERSEAEIQRHNILLKRLQNEACPIVRMPAEVLLIIFAAVAGLPWTSTTPHIFGQVCHRWREIIIGEHGASLWSTIMFDVQTKASALVSRLTSQLQLSRSSPVTLGLKLWEWECDWSVIIPPLLEPHASRVTTVSIEGPTYNSELSLFLSPMSNLQNLILRDFPEDEPILSQEFPRLKLLRLKSERNFPSESRPGAVMAILDNMSRFAHLTRLRFSYTVKEPQPEAFAMALSRFIDLIVLDLTIEEEPTVSTYPKPSSFTLPNLNTLTVRGKYALIAVTELCAPKLARLQVLPNEDKTYDEATSTLQSWFSGEALRFPELRVGIFPVLTRDEAFNDVLGNLCRLEEIELQLFAPQQEEYFSFGSLKMEKIALCCVQSTVERRLRRVHISGEGWDVFNDAYFKKHKLGPAFIAQLQSFITIQKTLLPPTSEPIRLTVDPSIMCRSTKLFDYIIDEPMTSVAVSLVDEGSWSLDLFDLDL